MERWLTYPGEPTKVEIARPAVPPAWRKTQSRRRSSELPHANNLIPRQINPHSPATRCKAGGVFFMVPV
jgi:hypothetical protein